MIRALLFDFDGVIVDTEVPTYQSWRDTYAEYGVDLALDDRWAYPEPHWR